MRNKTRSLWNLYCRSSCAFPGTVLYTFAALFITRTLLFNTNSGFFSRFSSFERLPSITVVFPRTFHHLYASLRCFTSLFVMWTLLFNNSGVWTLLFHISCVRCTFHRLQIFPLFLSFTLSLCFAYKFPPPLVWSQVRLSVFFILCAHFPQFKFFSRLLSFTPVASFPVLTLS